MLVWVIKYIVLGLSIEWESLFIDMYSPALLIAVWRQAIDHSASIISSIILLGQNSGQLSIILVDHLVNHFSGKYFSEFLSIIFGAIIFNRSFSGRSFWVDHLSGRSFKWESTVHQKMLDLKSIPSSALASLKLIPIWRFTFVKLLPKSPKMRVRKVVPEPADTSS